MTQIQSITHEDYADEGESAMRASAWPQAAALYRRAASKCDDAGKAEAYTAHAKKCDHEIEADGMLAAIAKRLLRIPTLVERNVDDLDFHEVSAWAVKDALRLAYQAGREAPR